MTIIAYIKIAMVKYYTRNNHKNNNVHLWKLSFFITFIFISLLIFYYWNVFAIQYAIFLYLISVFLSSIFHLQILTDLQSFQDKHLKADCEPLQIAVPKCYFSQYTSGVFPLTENVSIEPPESILVLEDMRTYGYKVWWAYIFAGGGRVSACACDCVGVGVGAGEQLNLFQNCVSPKMI